LGPEFKVEEAQWQEESGDEGLWADEVKW